MVGPGELRGGVAALLHDAPFAAITARGRDGRLWASPLTGRPGFLTATTLSITREFPVNDRLHGLEIGQPVGVDVVEFAAKRRVRINGTLTTSNRGVLQVDVGQAYGNCPHYVHPRRLEPENGSATEDLVTHRGETMDDDDVEQIGSADTFFLGTTRPQRGNDASHRGGPVGFVHADHTSVHWPDFPGNNMFNSLGNLAVDPTAALLFVDFDAGRTVQLSDRAHVEWSTPRSGDTGRRVRFEVERAVARQ